MLVPLLARIYFALLLLLLLGVVGRTHKAKPPYAPISPMVCVRPTTRWLTHGHRKFVACCMAMHAYVDGLIAAKFEKQQRAEREEEKTARGGEGACSDKEKVLNFATSSEISEASGDR